MLAFVRIQKTAGTTVLRILRRELGVGHCDVEPWELEPSEAGRPFGANDLRRLRRVYPRLTSVAGPTLRPYGDLADACPGLRPFTFLREPVVRCASHYSHDVRVHGYAKDLEAWLAERSTDDWQTRFLCGRRNLAAARDALDGLFFVGFVEAFEESLLLFARAVGDPRLDVSHRSANVAADTTIRDRLLADPGARRELEAANRLDRALYEHALHEVLPRQRAAHGPVDPQEVARLRAGAGVRRSWPGYPLNVAYRNLVYKPALWMARRRRPPSRRRATDSASSR